MFIIIILKVPDMNILLPYVKQKVLAGVNMLFSGGCGVIEFIAEAKCWDCDIV